MFYTYETRKDAEEEAEAFRHLYAEYERVKGMRKPPNPTDIKDYMIIAYILKKVLLDDEEYRTWLIFSLRLLWLMLKSLWGG